ncbi:E3 ubiquitin-protein ligase RSL1-like [Impatiens glandulifera]|uniref:E3 ubiquitin-protein ligase RSL1-like n=1 Tax=Impatiens glandulifera TaxID=253017 RepID=UPI001FB06CB0|nr:E3 ubiquitin-protein ligase RSL1-like [Impatiens glandulifera]
MANFMQRMVQLAGFSTPNSIQLSPPQKLHEFASFTCEICVEPTILPERKFKNGGFCIHPFCNDCIIKYVKMKIEIDKATEIKCPGLCCNFNLDILSCRSILPIKLFERWCDILFDKFILGFDLIYYPNRMCSALMVNECGGYVKQSICLYCKEPLCFKCKTSWQTVFDCKEIETIKDNNDIAFDILVKKNKWTKCPKCMFYVSLRSGCTKILL